jgi:hypothetical protein
MCLCARLDGRWIPDLPHGWGRLIGGDPNIGEEGSEQMIVTMQSLHHGCFGYQHVRTPIGLTKKAKFLQMQPRTQARIRKNTTKLVNECIAHECGVLQTIKR